MLSSPARGEIDECYGSRNPPRCDEYLRNNEAYARDFHGPLPLPPAKHTAVVACMDARLDVYRILGLHEGESHVIRNAGGVVTDDAIRSLVISQRLLGTNEIILIHHTDCGMLTFTDDTLRAQIAAETGFKPPYALNAFDDLAHLLHRDRVRGLIFDVATGRLNEVTSGSAR
jgi:carbonic anhydrase